MRRPAFPDRRVRAASACITREYPGCSAAWCDGTAARAARRSGGRRHIFWLKAWPMPRQLPPLNLRAQSARIDHRPDVAHAEEVDERRLAGLEVDFHLGKRGDERIRRRRCADRCPSPRPSAPDRRARPPRLGVLVDVSQAARARHTGRRARWPRRRPARRSARGPDCRVGNPLAADLVVVRATAEIACRKLLQLPLCVHRRRMIRPRHRVRRLAADRQARVRQVLVGAAPRRLRHAPTGMSSTSAATRARSNSECVPRLPTPLWT